MNKQDFVRFCKGENKSPFQTLVMGIINVTPDSFSDGGAFFDFDKAYRHAAAMVEQGADLIDIGGESTRPGAKEVPVEEELNRVIPLVTALARDFDICISVDTSKPAVMQAAVDNGAGCINDVYALRRPGALAIAAKLQVPVCIMHMQGTPQMMQTNPQYQEGVFSVVDNFFKHSIERCFDAGIPKDLLLLDPGFGFGKTVSHNLCLTRQIADFSRYGRPLVLGASRKSTLQAIKPSANACQVDMGLAFAAFGFMHGVSVVRTHDVRQTVDFLKVMHTIANTNEKEEMLT